MTTTLDTTAADRLTAASAEHTAAAHALHAADDALDAHWNDETLAAYGEARRRHEATGAALREAHLAYRAPRHVLDLDTMARIMEDGGRAATTGAPRAPMVSSPGYHDAIAGLPVGTPVPAMAAALFQAAYDGALDPATEDGLPLLPTVPGKVEGIVSLDPFTIQCRGCGTTDTAETVGVRPDRVAAVVILSSIRFHPTVWTTGETDNPRLCRSCRLARGCRCEGCTYERRG